ncbi:MAG: ferrochelatase [Tagaea sp.]|nr:ferrochelatase [Tagaea sp.]
MRKVAVVLFNLGGPDSPEAVRPFLFNLFNDPAIIGLPNPLRWLLAKLISKRRAPKARDIYARIGGSSPLLANTQAQARALEAALADLGEVRCFTAMRYWHPMTEGAVAAVKQFGPDRVVLLPLYPQYSTTTTGSSKKIWDEIAAKRGLTAQTSFACCYPVQPGFVAAVAAATAKHYAEAAKHGKPRVLFSAHGLPKKIVAAGDPYQVQVEKTAAAVIAKLGIADLDSVVCYQSRVGPLEWIGPATEDEIARAGRDKVPVVVVPLAFVSEHSETLVELDIEYREKAAHDGVPHYERVPTASTDPAFIAGLAEIVRALASGKPRACADAGQARLCPASCGKCPLSVS